MNKFTKFTLTALLPLTITLSTTANATKWYADGGSEEVKSHVLKRKHFSEIGSTQTLSYEMIEEIGIGKPTKLIEEFNQDKLDESQILLVTATQQTSGIGQGDRVWQSPPGNIYATFIFPWPKEAENLLPLVPQISNLAVCQAVKAFGFEPQFKWINDMLLNGKKSAGVLCKNMGVGSVSYYDGEKELPIEEYSPLVIGIGLNVNMDQEIATERFESINDPMKLPFTSMSIASGKSFDVDEVLDVLQTNLVKNLKILLKTRSLNCFLSSISPMLAYVGEKVEYLEGSEGNPHVATFMGITDHGYIKLKDEESKEETIHLSGRIRPYSGE